MKTIPASTAACLFALGLFASTLALSGASSAQTTANASSSPPPGDGWFERRMVLAYTYRDVGQALELDRKTESKLIDLLVTHELQRKKHFEPDALPTHSQPGGYYSHTQMRAEAETAQVAQLRDLLGPEKLERFLDFKVSLMERPFVTQLQRQLGPDHKLTVAQRERLVALYREHRAHEDDYVSVINSLRPVGIAMPEDLGLRYMIAGQELVFRNWPQSTQRLRQAAAEFLSAPQLAVLEKVHAAERDSFRMTIEDNRARAGLMRTIPAQSDMEIPRVRSRVAGEIELTAEIIVNRKPTRFTHVGPNDSSVTFPVAEDLFVEARPVLFDDDGFEVRLWFYEKSPAGKRLLADARDPGISHSMELPPSLERQGGTTEMIAGRKGYLITYTTVVATK